jgi:hypothetical protein
MRTTIYEENNMEDNLERYIKTQIEIFKKGIHLINDEKDISPSLLNEALANFTHVNIVINIEYQKIRKKLKNLEVELGLWWDEKFVEVRRELNDPSLAASKWLSKSELESETRSRYKEEYKDLEQKKNNLDAQRSFIQRMTEIWKTHGNILITLSNNMRQEMRSIGVSERANIEEYIQNNDF